MAGPMARRHVVATRIGLPEVEIAKRYASHIAVAAPMKPAWFELKAACILISVSAMSGSACRSLIITR